jgi:hypothetical protein
MRWRSKTACGATLALVLLGAPILPLVAQSSPKTDFAYHFLVPLGTEAFQLPMHRTLYLMGTARSPKFEGWKPAQGARRAVLGSNGTPVRFYPEAVQFRISAATLRENALVVPPSPAPLAVDDLNEFLLGLHFQVKVFRGLTYHVVEPESVEMIGMPAEIQYNERVYRVSFELGRVPISDRVVLEVLDPAGERVCKFHLDF